MLVDTDGGFGERVLARLARFKLRTKVEIERLPWSVLALRGEAAAGAGAAAHPSATRRARRSQRRGRGSTSPGRPASCPWTGTVGPASTCSVPKRPCGLPPGLAAAGAEAWQARRIESGVPRWDAELDERTIAAEADLVGRTVSFTKGCYTGQELVARLEPVGAGSPAARRGPPPDAPVAAHQLIGLELRAPGREKPVGAMHLGRVVPRRRGGGRAGLRPPVGRRARRSRGRRPRCLGAPPVEVRGARAGVTWAPARRSRQAGDAGSGEGPARCRRPRGPLPGNGGGGRRAAIREATPPAATRSIGSPRCRTPGSRPGRPRPWPTPARTRWPGRARSRPGRLPARSEVKCGSNTRARSAGAIPGPSSATQRSTTGPSLRPGDRPSGGRSGRRSRSGWRAAARRRSRSAAAHTGPVSGREPASEQRCRGRFGAQVARVRVTTSATSTSSARRRTAGVEPGQVEEVLDQPLEPARLGRDHGHCGGGVVGRALGHRLGVAAGSTSAASAARGRPRAGIAVAGPGPLEVLAHGVDGAASAPNSGTSPARTGTRACRSPPAIRWVASTAVFSGRANRLASQ